MSIFEYASDSELGRWRYAEWRPDAGHALAWAVEKIWDFDGQTQKRRERVFPNGSVELILQLDGRHHDVLDHGLVLTPAACVSGVATRALVVQAPSGPGRVLGLRLYPPGAWALLHHPLGQLCNVTADLADLLGRAAPELADRCDSAATARNRLTLAVAWLTKMLAASRVRVDPAVRWIAAAIARANGATPIARLRGQVGLSEARLVATFREQVGVTPKHYARIHRFQGALALLAEGRHGLAAVAAAAGYYDQPHMNLEFREMAGLTPGEYLARPRYPNSASLPESMA
jgi:AraC-like DNA-binding protein